MDHNEMVREPKTAHEDARGWGSALIDGDAKKLPLLHHMRAAMLCSSSPTASA